MAETTGGGGSLAAAFREALSKVSLGRPRESYTAAGWHAQVRQLTGTERGYQAMSEAGVHATRRTLTAWLSEERAPSKANREAISRAYEAMRRGGIPDWVKRGDLEVTGRVKTGRDDRDRGQAGAAPFRVDLGAGNEPRITLGEPGRTHWEAIERAIEDGADDDELEELIGDLIAEDVTPSDLWEFPGSSYGVVITG